MFALVSSRQELEKSLWIAFIRPLQRKLLQSQVARSERVSYPGFLGVIPCFWVIKMLRFFGMTSSSSNSNGRIRSEDNKDNQSDDDNKENEMSASSDPKELTSSSQGDGGTTDHGDPVLPRQIFWPCDISTPSSSSTAPTADVDLCQRRQSATVHDQVAEDPNKPHMNPYWIH
jgi:hypothetical protein